MLANPGHSINASERKPLAIVLEDNRDLQDIYASLLAPRFEVRPIHSLAEFRSTLSGLPDPGLFLTDLDLGDGSLLTLMTEEPCAARVKAWPSVVVSVEDDLTVLKACVANWAVDYLTKPFNNNELVFRCWRAYEAAELVLDPTELVAKAHGKRSETLTATEAKLFSFLKAQAARAATRQDIMLAVWGEKRDSGKLDTTLSRLRRKIHPLGVTLQTTAPGVIAIVKGVGDEPIQ